ncbi:MAG: hypothetical protein JW937_09485 [Candidatus Omnitrophica bacterium]|nr:hypothetical protein [Candidatus Omnitrophota bacterium]
MRSIIVRISRRVTVLAVLAAVCFLGLYYRTYFPRLLRSLDQRIESLDLSRELQDQLRFQLQGQVSAANPDWNEDQRAAWVETQLQTLISTQQEQYQEALDRLQDTKRRQARGGYSRHYLTGADSYHYFHLTNTILEKGRVSGQVASGRAFDPLKRAPHGAWSPINAHPYLGVMWFHVRQIRNHGAGLMATLAEVPLGLSCLCALAFFCLALTLGLSSGSAIAGTATLLFAPIFISRSSFGWYDTDPYNLLFPILILCTVFLAFRVRGHSALAAVLGGFLTALYALFWAGWPFICGLLVLACAFSPYLRRAYLPWYLILALGFGMAFLTPAGLLFSLDNALGLLLKFSSSEAELWPNILIAVGEAQGPTFHRLVQLSGNYLSTLAAVAGIAGFGLHARRSGSELDRVQWIVGMLIGIPLLVLALKAQRFALLWVLPLSLYVAWCVEWLNRSFRFRFAPLLLIAVLLPVQLAYAHSTAMRTKPIMNDAWYEALTVLRHNSPENAIVQSWWPPGHFIRAIAGRAVFTDGETQYFPEAYWTARFFMAENSLEALGILRMLSTNGNAAVDYLLDLGLPLPDAVAAVNELVKVSRSGAHRLLPVEMSEAQKLRLLGLTHGDQNPPPVYVLLYTNMLDSILDMALMAGWNFFKARDQLLAQGRVIASTNLESDSYKRELFALSPSAYHTHVVTHPSPKLSAIGQAGSVTEFEGNVFCDPASKRAWRLDAAGGERREFGSILVVDPGGGLREMPNPAGYPEESLLTVNAEGEYYALSGNPHLLKSMAYQLFYYRGIRLPGFKLVNEEQDPVSGTGIRIFEVDWSALRFAARNQVVQTPLSPETALPEQHKSGAD